MRELCYNVWEYFPTKEAFIPKVHITPTKLHRHYGVGIAYVCQILPRGSWTSCQLGYCQGHRQASSRSSYFSEALCTYAGIASSERGQVCFIYVSHLALPRSSFLRRSQKVQTQSLHQAPPPQRMGITKTGCYVSQHFYDIITNNLLWILPVYVHRAIYIT